MGGKLTIYHGSQKLIQQPVMGQEMYGMIMVWVFTAQKIWILQKNGHVQKKIADMPIVIN